MPLNCRFVAWWAVVAAFGVAIIYLRPKSSSSFKEVESLHQKCLSTDGNPNDDLNVFCVWMEENQLLDYIDRFEENGIRRLEDVFEMDDKKLKILLSVDNQLIRNSLPQDLNEISKFKQKMQNRFIAPIDPTPAPKRSWVREMLTVMIMWCVALGLGRLYNVWLRASNGRNFLDSVAWLVNTELKDSALQWLTGHRALASNAVVNFEWEEPCLVGNTVTFTVQFFQRWNGRPYPVSDADSIRINVRQNANKIAAAVEIGGSEMNQVKATFTVRKAGQYHIDIHLGPYAIHGSPFIKTFLPGPPDASKINLIRPTSMVVCTVGCPHQLLLEPRDEYGNFCSWSQENSQKALESFSLEAFAVGSTIPVRPLIQWLWIELVHRLLVHVTFDEEGIYDVRLKYNGTVINKAEFNMIALSRSEAAQVVKALGNRTLEYEAKLVSMNGEKWIKNKKVFCALSPKQIALKEYILGFFPKRLATFRLCPATKFTFQGSNNMHELPTLIIDDGAQLKVEIASKEAHLMAASFAHYLMKNIGGSETFADKQGFFYQEIRKYHQKKPHDKLLLRVERDQILFSSFRLTKSFGAGDWCKNFEITFVGEEGLDWGGLRREWIELLCVAIFDKKHSGMFTSFSEDVQALVHPNPKMPSNCKLKYYEFSGKLVGKCLYESSLGATYRQLVKARFARSFLAQLIGLRVNYKYFEHDDPQLFLSKIKYIQDNDVADMELTFTEDEYDEGGQLLRTVELIPGGARIQVNNSNKYQYLDALAHYRLVTSVKEQVDAFVRGLNELVPDSLLSIFDENELELLVCGTSEYSVAQLKSNHVVIGSSPEFQKVMSWFWTAVTNFGAEELSRLLQFTTGSSQLPPGGLAELSPKLQITASPSFGTLPTAHTCFNQLCLPDYDTYEQFEKALLLAINEGSEGFGLV